ncbi:hypothetical protein M406DRAFT_228119, partial [Cryphonectria parasitica EP155]
RQFILMAISGSIGAGLFIASGEALQKGGPGSLVLAFLIVGLAVWLTMCALGELASTIPARGSFYDYSVRFVSESWGFAMGWNYVVNFMLIVGFEITVIVRLARYWVGADASVLSSGVIAAVPACHVVLAVLQCFGPKWYGEAEHFFGILKVFILTTFIGTAVVIAAGGTPEAGGRGFENYLHGQAFRNGFQGSISVLAAAGLAYGGTEMLGLTAAACAQPRKVMPLGAKLVAGRILLCYCTALFALGLVLRPSALDSPEIANLTASPFVIAVRVADIPRLPDIINGLLIASVFSMGNSAVFASSRALAAICERGMGPRVLSRFSERGVPWAALLVVFSVAMLAWLAAVRNGTEIFEWLLALASVSNLFTWMSINICHIRLRKALRFQGRNPDLEVAWQACCGVWGSYLAAVMIVCIMIAQVASAALPPVLNHDGTLYFIFLLRGILGFVVVAVFWVGHLVY